MSEKVKFGVRLSRVISVVSPDSRAPYLTPYERIY